MPLISAPAEIPLTCMQGSPFQQVLRFFQDEGGTEPVDFTGYTFDMEISEGVADSGIEPVMLLSNDPPSGPARISFIGANLDDTPDIEGSPDPTNGMIYIHLHSAETVLLREIKPPKARSYPVTANLFYDIEATPPGGEPFRIAYGTFKVTYEITRRD